MAGEIPCEPVNGATTVTVDADDLAGEYRLTLVANRGDAAGGSAEGRLWLRPNEAELRGLPSPGGGIRQDAGPAVRLDRRGRRAGRRPPPR